MREPHSEGKLKLLLSQTVRQSEGNVDLEMSSRPGNVDIAGESCCKHVSIKPFPLLGGYIIVIRTLVIWTQCGVYGNFINRKGPGCSTLAVLGRY